MNQWIFFSYTIIGESLKRKTEKKIDLYKIILVLFWWIQKKKLFIVRTSNALFNRKTSDTANYDSKFIFNIVCKVQETDLRTLLISYYWTSWFSIDRSLLKPRRKTSPRRKRKRRNTKRLTIARPVILTANLMTAGKNFLN